MDGYYSNLVFGVFIGTAKAHQEIQKHTKILHNMTT